MLLEKLFDSYGERLTRNAESLTDVNQVSVNVIPCAEVANRNMKTIRDSTESVAVMDSIEGHMTGGRVMRSAV